jgi:hypothetical protein
MSDELKFKLDEGNCMALPIQVKHEAPHNSAVVFRIWKCI